MSAPVPTFEKAGILGKLTFFWTFPILRSLHLGKIAQDDLSVTSKEAAANASAKVDRAWASELSACAFDNSDAPAEKKLREPSLLKVLIRCFWPDFLLAALCKLVWGTLVIVCAYVFVRYLVNFVNEYKTNPNNVSVTDGWIYAAFFWLACMVLSMALQQMTSLTTRMGVRLRAALLSSILNKSIRIFDANAIAGDIMNLATNDCQRLLESCTFLHYIWSAPLETLAILSLLIVLIGPAALLGWALMAVIVPVQFYLAFLTSRTRSETISVTDVRVQLMHEILMAMKLVKFYAWERAFVDKVKEIRVGEEKLLSTQAVWRSFSLTIVFVIPPAIALVIFSYYTSVEGKLPAVIAFTTLSLFNTLRFPLVVLPRAIRNFAEALAAVRRIQKFLLMPEFNVVRNVESLQPIIDLEDVDVAYTKEVPKADEDGKQLAASKGGPVVRGVTVRVRPGELMMIVGPVGSGKSTLVLTMLQQTFVLDGRLEVRGSTAYVPQQPWVQAGTIRDNILFGNAYDPEWYNTVVHACALERDLEIVGGGGIGDMYMVAERGINLSGGQRQRISLARAVYARAQIYILDNPLSAVDEHTAAHLMNYCIHGLLKDTICVLVTHKLHLLSEADTVVVMRSGEIAYAGAYNDDVILTHFAAFANDYLHAPDPDQHKKSQAQHIPSALEADDRKHEPKWREMMRKREEDQRLLLESQVLEKQKGKSGKKGSERLLSPDEQYDPSVILPPKYADLRLPPFILWFKQAGFGWSGLSIFIFVVTQVIRIISDTWISWWAQDSFSKPQTFYVGMYAMFVGLFMTFLFIRGFFFFYIMRRTASAMHNTLFANTLKSTMHYFCTTPLGKLLTCFSKDQDVIDESLQDTSHITIVYLMILLTTATLVSIVFPVFAAVVGGVVIVFAFVFSFYLRGVRVLKGWAAQTSPPIFAHLSESLTGISTIRAFNAEERFVNKFVALIDRNNSVFFTMDQMQLWLAFCLDFLGSGLVLTTAMLCIGQRNNITAAAAGLAISNSFQILIFFAMFCKGISEIDAQVYSVFRIKAFSLNEDVERSDPTEDSQKPPKSWPHKGSLKMENVVMRYDERMDPALRGVSFEFLPREKIGVVGRTGSGKSSIIMTIFRLYEPENGTMTVDGVDLSKISLSDVRSSLAIIPQEPVMFRGTVRSNLDPFNLYHDDEIWKSLELSHLKPSVSVLQQKLLAPVTENGSNFSLGQRQLFCLARAILNQSKILFLDEATAAMDLETDALIQDTIRRVFSDRTVVTIAHRLQTIIASDRILVMDSGVVKEFDSPWNLLDNPGGVFYDLVEKSGSSAAGLHAAVRERRPMGERRGSVIIQPGQVDPRRADALARRSSIAQVRRRSTIRPTTVGSSGPTGPHFQAPAPEVSAQAAQTSVAEVPQHPQESSAVPENVEVVVAASDETGLKTDG
eukprot:ANDGO_04493.mRNA.1 ABC transporter C family member 3